MNIPSPVRTAATVAVFGGLTAGAAALGARATNEGKGLWYRLLRKPSFQPPDWVFGPVWTSLFTLIAASGYRVSRTRSPGRPRTLALWGLQLGLNVTWSYLFFGRRRAKASLAELALLFGAISAYIASARKVDKPAAWMMVPYLGWVAFAGLLNAELVRKNPLLLR